MRAGIALLLNTPSWCGQGSLWCYFASDKQNRRYTVTRMQCLSSPTHVGLLITFREKQKKPLLHLECIKTCFCVL